MPEDPLIEAQVLAGASSKTATIVSALHELIRVKKIQKLRRLRGKPDLEALRRDRTSG